MSCSSFSSHMSNLYCTRQYSHLSLNLLGPIILLKCTFGLFRFFFLQIGFSSKDLLLKGQWGVLYSQVDINILFVQPLVQDELECNQNFDQEYSKNLIKDTSLKIFHLLGPLGRLVQQFAKSVRCLCVCPLPMRFFSIT